MSEAQRQAAAAKRMRRTRARQREGFRTVMAEIHDAELEFLAARGHLNADCADDKREIGLEIERLMGELVSIERPDLLA